MTPSTSPQAGAEEKTNTPSTPTPTPKTPPAAPGTDAKTVGGTSQQKDK